MRTESDLQRTLVEWLGCGFAVPFSQTLVLAEKSEFDHGRLSYATRTSIDITVGSQVVRIHLSELREPFHL